ncbi:MAG: endonuclease/exonuclease/phosphatase family protein [bacterium]
MTYNIHSCKGTDGMYSPNRVGTVIAQNQPDIVTLQEVDSGYFESYTVRQIEQIAEVTGMRWYHGPSLQSNQGEYGNALLTRYPVLKIQRKNISFLKREPRGIIDCTVAVRNFPVRILTTHFGLRSAERRHQLACFMDVVSGAEKNITPLIVTGDFNEWNPWGPVKRRLKRYFGKQKHCATYPARFPLLGLDRIYVTPESTVIKQYRDDSAAGKYASDHRPLIIELSVPPDADGKNSTRKSLSA